MAALWVCIGHYLQKIPKKVNWTSCRIMVAHSIVNIVFDPFDQCLWCSVLLWYVLCGVFVCSYSKQCIGNSIVQFYIFAFGKYQHFKYIGKYLVNILNIFVRYQYAFVWWCGRVRQMSTVHRDMFWLGSRQIKTSMV